MNEKRTVYLDNSATTKISKSALDKYIEVSTGVFGNPSSLHDMGFLAEKELNAARDAIKKSLSFTDSTVVFTASGSEANNLAIIGRALSKDRYRRGAKIITSDSEHASVNEPLDRLAREGFKTAFIPTRGGELDLSVLEAELDSSVILVTLMLVNNETGAIYDIAEAAKIIRRKSPEALIHVDATQAYMKMRITRTAVPFDMITLSSHKIEGPKGVGALVIDNKVIKQKGLSPIVFGGGQEGGLRSGTENVPGIAAFAEAIREGVRELEVVHGSLLSLRDYLIDKISSDEVLSEISLTLPKSHAPHILNITLPKIKSEVMLHYLSSLGIYVSSGSACSSNSAHASSALIAYGRSEKEADSSIRISLSKRNTKEDIDALCDALKSGIARLAKMR